MTKVFSVFALLLALGTAACNTVQGAGMDIKATGNAVERAAEDAKR
jgi:predicted small secreted protein